MKQCMNFSDCGGFVNNSEHDYCYGCFLEIQDRDDKSTSEDNFEKILTMTEHTRFM